MWAVRSAEMLALKRQEMGAGIHPLRGLTPLLERDLAAFRPLAFRLYTFVKMG